MCEDELLEISEGEPWHERLHRGDSAATYVSNEAADCIVADGFQRDFVARPAPRTPAAAWTPPNRGAAAAK